MTNRDDDIEKALSLRLSQNAKKMNYTLPIDMFDCLRNTSCSIINGSERKVVSPSGDFKDIRWEKDTNKFFTPVNSGLEKRVVPFANYLLKSKIYKQVLVNFNDAEGHDYSRLLPSNLTFQGPIQYARTKSQRDYVTLFPLGKSFMGLGSRNVPLERDDLPFEKKKDTLVWRGAPSGVYFTNFNEKKSARNTVYEKAPHTHFSKFARLSLIPELSKKPEFNVGFTAPSNDNYRKLVDYLKVNLPTSFSPKMNIADQRAYKYLLAIDGNDIPSNIFWALMSNSVVLKVESEWETALCAGLEPWVHYVPVTNVESIEKAINFLNDNITL